MTIRYVGLHIGRTAGTSFYHYVESALGIRSCLPISTFTHDILRGRLTPLERIDSEEPPLFTYGHYVHESWFEYLRHQGDVLGFSFYRDPVERRISLHRHAAALDQSRQGSRFVAHLQAKDIWCQEVLRCFPTAAHVLGGQPVWEQALLALSTLDYLLPMENAEEFARRLLEASSPRATTKQFPSLNPSRSTLPAPPEPSVALDEQDLLLYQAVKNGQRSSDVQIRRLRDAIADKYRDPVVALATFRRHLLMFMRSEMRSYASLDECVQTLKTRRQSLDEILLHLEGHS